MAEEYHQDYLNKNPQGYCHIDLESFQRAKEIIVDPYLYVNNFNKDLSESKRKLPLKVIIQKDHSLMNIGIIFLMESIGILLVENLCFHQRISLGQAAVGQVFLSL